METGKILMASHIYNCVLCGEELASIEAIPVHHAPVCEVCAMPVVKAAEGYTKARNAWLDTEYGPVLMERQP